MPAKMAGCREDRIGPTRHLPAKCHRRAASQVSLHVPRWNVVRGSAGVLYTAISSVRQRAGSLGLVRKSARPRNQVRRRWWWMSCSIKPDPSRDTHCNHVARAEARRSPNLSLNWYLLMLKISGKSSHVEQTHQRVSMPSTLGLAGLRQGTVQSASSL